MWQTRNCIIQSGVTWRKTTTCFAISLIAEKQKVALQSSYFQYKRYQIIALISPFALKIMFDVSAVLLQNVFNTMSSFTDA